jgi:hypothetical protein
LPFLKIIHGVLGPYGTDTDLFLEVLLELRQGTE